MVYSNSKVVFLCLLVCGAVLATAQSDAAEAVRAVSGLKKSGAGGSLGSATSSLLAGATQRLEKHIASSKAAMGELLQLAGIDPNTLTKDLTSIANDGLGLMKNVRKAYETTLQNYFGLYLDNTKELRKRIEDGNLVIDSIEALRGAECTAAEFTPPEVVNASIVGTGAYLSVTTGQCQLVRVASPLQLDFILSCGEPTVTFSTSAPRFTSKYVAAAAATTKECKVERKYGVESTTTITLFSPAYFFAPEPQSVRAAGGPSKGSTTTITANATTKAKHATASNWYKMMIQAKESGDGWKQLPKLLREQLVAILKDMTVKMAIDYKPINQVAETEAKINALTAIAAEHSAFARTASKVWSGRVNDLMKKPINDLLKDFTIKGNMMKDPAAAMNITKMFDNVFSSGMAKLLASKQGPLGQQGAAEAVKIMEQIGKQSLGSLLSKVRNGARPQAVNVTFDLGDYVTGERLSKGLLEGLGSGKVVPGSLGELILKKGGQKRMKELAEKLAAGLAVMKG